MKIIKTYKYGYRTFGFGWYGVEGGMERNGYHLHIDLWRWSFRFFLFN